MVKIMFFLKRKPGMTVMKFHNYWHHVHSNIAAKIPNLKKYNLCCTLPSQYEEKTPPYDGVAELWFDTEDDLKNAMQSEEWQLAEKDADVFLDRSNHTSIVCIEKFIKQM